MNLFLKARHWQLFLLAFVLPMMILFVTIGIMAANIIDHVVVTNAPPDPKVIMGYMKFMPMGLILLTILTYGWFWSVAVGLQKKVPAEVKLNVLRFKISFFVPIVFLIFVMVFIRVVIGGIIETGVIPDPGIFITFFVIVIPMNLLSTVCSIHTIYFTAKTFKTIEMQKEADFTDFIAEFFLIWFYPIGVWVIQPKINKMIEE
jgi:hypothetical protein